MISNLRNITVAEIDWRGVRVRVSYEADYLGMMASYGAGSAHLQVEAVTPKGARLPITETGYRSHFCAPSAIGATGGPLPFALAWLDHEARQPGWREWQSAQDQLSLF